MISTGIKIGVSTYVSNVEHEGNFVCECFPARTDAMVLLIMPILSDATSWVTKIPIFPVCRKI